VSAGQQLALTGGSVLTGLVGGALVTADVVVEGARIVSVGPAPAGVPRRDCSGTLIIPGNVCGHTHLYSALARGMPFALESPANFTQILQRVWWRLDRALDEESVRLSALAGGLDALLCGTTTLVDHHASPDAIDGSLDVMADALERLGLRSVLCYEVSDRDGPERAQAGVAENERFLKSVGSGGRSLTRGLMGAHASFTLSEETLAACVEGAAGAGVGLHIHVAEDAADQRDAQAQWAVRVVDRLQRAGVVTDQALLAHCVQVDDAEIAALASSGATVAHNARSNMNNAVGRSPVTRFGDRVVLGTDGIDGDMFAESRAAFWRAREADVYTLASWPLDRLAQGARFAGRSFGEPALGRIEPGAPADLTVLDYRPPTPLSADNLAGHWMFGLSARRVRDVVVAGELVVADRRLTRVDQDELLAEITAGATRLWDRLADIPPHPFQPRGASS
jgi:putative selenium metabolism protein SsnA